MRIRGIHLLGCMAALLCIDAVHAEMRHVEFKGTLTRVDSGTILDGVVSAGMPFSGRIAYDDEMEDSYPDDPHAGVYYYPEIPLCLFEVQLGPVVFHTDSFKIKLWDDVDVYPEHLNDFWAVGPIHDTSAYMNGEYLETWEGMGLSMIDFMSEALKSDLLTEEIDLDEWDVQQVIMYPWAYGPVIKGDVTSFEYVPEPSSLVILLTGAIALIRRR